MMSIATALAALDTQRDNLAANLTTKGVTAANTETLSQLVPKVLDITGGGTPITAGVSILDVAADGRPTSVAVYGESLFPSMFNSNGYAVLTSVRFESEVTTIGTRAFENCTNLALTELPETITSLGTYAFNGCSNLALTQLPSGLLAIPSTAFKGCKKLAITSIPISVTSISVNSFHSCTGIVNLHIKNGAITYGYSSFYNCTGLRNVIIGDVGSPVSAIAANTFSYCTQTGLTISVYCTDPSTPPTGAPWGATKATVNYLQA